MDDVILARENLERALGQVDFDSLETSNLRLFRKVTYHCITLIEELRDAVGDAPDFDVHHAALVSIFTAINDVYNASDGFDVMTEYMENVLEAALADAQTVHTLLAV